MGQEQGVEILVHYSRKRKLEVDFSERYDRTAHEDESVEAIIERTWAERKANNGRLFNGRKFRFSGHTVTLTEDAWDVCTLRLGLTDYKTYLGTHCVADAVMRFGEAWMGQPLGNVVIPETSDGQTVLLVRSSHTGEGAGGVVFPGGHAEPDMVEGLQEGDTRVERELWDGARREVMEELWIGDKDVCKVEEMLFLGMVRRTEDRKVSMVFSVKVGLKGEEVLKAFTDKNDGTESDEMMRVKLSEMESVTRKEDSLAETRAAAHLWLEMKKVAIK